MSLSDFGANPGSRSEFTVDDFHGLSTSRFEPSRPQWTRSLDEKRSRYREGELVAENRRNRDEKSRRWKINAKGHVREFYWVTVRSGRPTRYVRGIGTDFSKV